MSRYVLGLDIGSNSVGSVWIDREKGTLTTGTSIFPAGVDESEDTRGEPKNAKRRMTRRTRITLRRRAQRKRELRLKLIQCGLLPLDAASFKELLEKADPWELRRDGLDKPLTPHQFGRVLLHLAQRRGALGLKVTIEENEEGKAEATDDGAVKKAIGEMRLKMIEAKARTFGEFIAMKRGERVHALTGNGPGPKGGPRQWREAVRNKAGNYVHCADRAMIRDEFRRLWEAQKRLGGETAKLLSDVLRIALDDPKRVAMDDDPSKSKKDKEEYKSTFREGGLLFEQRFARWDEGTLGRCVLEPTERCAPHADMHASRYLVVETINNLKIIERGKMPRPLTPGERVKVKAFLSGPLGMLPPKIIKDKKGKDGKVIKGKTLPERPKTTVSVTDLRELMGWGKATKTAPFRFNIEADEDREINTDWFNREVVHSAVGVDAWEKMPESLREGINRALIKHDPDQDGDEKKLKDGVMKWAALSESQAGALVAAWKRRPKIDAKRLSMSRRAVRNLLIVMDRDEPWPDPRNENAPRWLTQIESRKAIADWERTTGDAEPFKDVTTGKLMDDITRRRYATGVKGATAKDRHYMGKHVLMKDGKPVIGPDGMPLAEPPPAPLISNPVVRKAIHEVRRHVVEYMMTFGRKPDEIYIELAREAKMGAKDANRLLFKNRLRNRIRRDITASLNLDGLTPTQQRAAVDRVVLCVQQGGLCPLCGNQAVPTRFTPRLAADRQGCEVAHIIPRASGGHNGLNNLVLAHIKCNRDMARRTPRQFWTSTLNEGFDEGFRWVEGIFSDVRRPKPAEVRSITGDALWACYFDFREDRRKIEQFAKDVKDIQDMTARQEAATQYATRQVMAYLADALFDGKGLPERGGDRLIFATDGLWTSRLRREWGLFFDSHDARAKGLSNAEEHQRKEKNRGDHRHHAIDAVVIALCTRSVQVAWEDREKAADAARVNTADEEEMEAYRRKNPLPPPAPYWQGNAAQFARTSEEERKKARENFREAVRAAVFGNENNPRPICHRAVKRKIVGELHEAFPRGPVLDHAGRLTDKFTKRISILELDRKHLREPREEPEKEAIDRLAARRMEEKKVDESTARKWARSVVRSPGYTPAIVDPPPSKSGLVRDPELRRWLRKCLEDNGLKPDDFSSGDLKKLVEAGKIRQGLRGRNGRMTADGPPICSIVLLWTIKSPVIASLRESDYTTGKPRRVFDADTNNGDARAARAYIGGKNHHIEIRVDEKGEWQGDLVSMFEASRRKLGFFRAVQKADVPPFKELKKMSPAERRKHSPAIRAAEKANPLVDRSDNPEKGGRFVMSLCEGETLWMLHKQTKAMGFFVVAKLDTDRQFIVVPHWDARAAGLRKDSDNKPVPYSMREQFPVTPSDLLALAPPGEPHARKVRVSVLGEVTLLDGD